MTGNQYRAVHPAYVALHGADVFDHDFETAGAERDALESGHFELVARPYRVLIDNYTVDGHPVARGDVFEAAFPMENESALIDGGILERVRRDAQPTVDQPVADQPAKPPAKRASRKG